MGLFNFFKKGTNKLDFSEIDSNEKAQKLYKKNILAPLYLMPLRFNGEAIPQNTLYVPPVVVMLKDRYDDMVENLLVQEKVNGYECKPQYRGNSFIPCSLTVIAKKDGQEVFTETIEVW
ncbi:hypothetical protein [Inconstantimicrobium mannanitabidum]|uniref:Uncharacterized protein n=1 Tax=Inconstantimicrobium mannanitabidum TaxID=1604901 RepID=A0ACB5RBB8_9CLOT|nr:hypothetical protein [Clostridium sp. TW13]GKX66415.1 hypothetical protein rsdtw13_16730 [Clostridium sp. TW13]